MLKTSASTPACRCKAIAIGGGASNFLHGIKQKESVEHLGCIAADTDLQSLSSNAVEANCLLGISGLGTGGDSAHGRKMALRSKPGIRACLERVDVLFILACLGGGTGGGASSVVAELARKMGLLTIAVVTLPFHFERLRLESATAQINELAGHVDSLIVLPNEDATHFSGAGLSMGEALDTTEGLIRNVVRGITELVLNPEHANQDILDLKARLPKNRQGAVASARASGPRKAQLAARNACQSPSLDTERQIQARSVILIISARTGELDTKEVNVVETIVRNAFPKDVDFMLGTVDASLPANTLDVTVIAY